MAGAGSHPIQHHATNKIFFKVNQKNLFRLNFFGVDDQFVGAIQGGSIFFRGYMIVLFPQRLIVYVSIRAPIREHLCVLLSFLSIHHQHPLVPSSVLGHTIESMDIEGSGREILAAF